MKRSALFLLVFLVGGLACRLFSPEPGAVEQPDGPANVLPTPPVATLPVATLPVATLPVEPTLSPSSPSAQEETPDAAQLAGLQATLVAGLPPTPTPGGDDFGGLGGVILLPLEPPAGEGSLWAAYSVGSRGFDPLQNHFVAVYRYGSGKWQELSRLELPGPDYLGEGSLKPATIEPENLWLLVEGGAGAHSGTFDLLIFRGGVLQNVLSHFTDTPLAGELRDLDSDGAPEVLLNTSDNYVFCYACGVRVWDYQVWRWDGGHLVEVQLSRLPQPAADELTRLNDRAVALAQGELWKEALETIQQAQQLDDQNPTVVWNAALIGLIAGTRAVNGGIENPYPLLGNIFSGDWEAALDLVRPYPPEQVFNPTTPLVAGTVADGWETQVRDYIDLFAGRALQVKPDLAPAYFFRAWATYLVEPNDPGVLAGLEQAVALDPEEGLYSSAVEYVRNLP